MSPDRLPNRRRNWRLALPPFLSIWWFLKCINGDRGPTGIPRYPVPAGASELRSNISYNSRKSTFTVTQMDGAKRERENETKRITSDEYVRRWGAWTDKSVTWLHATILWSIVCEYVSTSHASGHSSIQKIRRYIKKNIWWTMVEWCAAHAHTTTGEE